MRTVKSLLLLSWIAFGGWDGARAANLNSVSSLATTNALPNGSFEAPALPVSPGFQYLPAGSGWTLTGGAGISRNGTGFTSGNPNAPQGSQVLLLQGIASASQTITCVAGYYTFNFYAAQRGNMPNTQTFELRVDGALVQSFTPSGATYTNYTSNLVLVNSGTHTIELRGTNPLGTDNTAFIDDIKTTRIRDISLSGFESPALPVSPGFAYAPTGGPWTFGGGSGLSRNGSGFTASNPAAPEGNQVMFLQGGSSASTTMTVQRAGYYRFKFKAALRGANPTQPTAKNIRITVGSTPVGEFSLTSTNYTEKISLAIFLNVGAQTVTITGVDPLAGDHTGLVDDLRYEMLHDWQDPYVWGGAVPGPSDNAEVMAGSSVVMQGTVNAKTVMVSGELIGAQNSNINATANYLMAMGTGALIELGQDLVPYPMSATITLNAPVADKMVNVMGMGNKFLGAMGNATLHLHGANKNSWTQLGANVSPGSSTITLKEAVNWQVNDTIVVVSSRTNWNEAEKRKITAITGGGTILTLNAPLAYPHVGVVKSYSNGTQNWTADLRAEVGLLTHNIRVQGDAASNATGAGFGGHIMIMDNSYGYIGGVELFNMGQKAMMGRYPMHWHMLGSVGAGQYFKNSSVHLSYNRAVTIHGTESTLVENNFLYDHIGHGVFLEDGSERFNVIRKNVCLLTKRPAIGQELTPSDNQFDQVQNRTPASYWITNPQNTFDDNVAAGTQGTGFWYALPQRPTGLSANDPRFSAMVPSSLPMISFKGNSAHSCMSGFDIFDQLDANHSIVPNGSWDDPGIHVMENCLWYANDLALYTGIGNPSLAQNLIFRNNVMVENVVATMLASYSIVENSVFVANSGENLVSGTRYAYRVYDGAGQVRNSHFEGWNVANANFLINTGAAIKHPNHIFTNNTKSPASAVHIDLENFDIPPVDAHANHPGHPRYWSIVLRDLTGDISGKANTSIVSNQPFMLVGDEFKDPNWNRTYRSDHRFVLSRLTYGVAFEQTPNIVCTREKAGTATESVYYIKGYREWHQLPFLVNENYQYTYTYESLPSVKTVTMNMEDATAGDNYIARFKDFGKLGTLTMSSTQAGFSSRTSLANLQSSTTSAYFVQTNGDLYIKAVATQKNQSFTISWPTSIAMPGLDTDGDQMKDSFEINAGRNAFDAGDLAAEFNTNSDFEDWTDISNISAATVSAGKLTGTSINNGDAIISNAAYNFAADRVPHLFVNMKASTNTAVQIFFATAANPGFSGARVVTANYTGAGAFQTLTFDMNADAAWSGTVTDLRLDPVSGVGITFEIDWIRSRCQGTDTDGDGVCNFEDICANFDDHLIGTSCNDGNPATFPDAWTTGCLCGQGSFKLAGAGESAANLTQDVVVYPNPFSDILTIDLGIAGKYHTVQLLDLQGRILNESPIAADMTYIAWNLGAQPVAAGIYFVQVIGNGERVQRKLVKQ